VVDAGTNRPGRALEVLSCGANEIVVGLESLHAFGDLGDIVELVGPSRVIFSLDLRLGSPILHPALQDASGAADALSLASQAVDAGIRTLLVLDIGRVGTGCGVDLGLLEALRRRSWLRLLAGGGVLTDAIWTGCAMRAVTPCWWRARSMPAGSARRTLAWPGRALARGHSVGDERFPVGADCRGSPRLNSSSVRWVYRSHQLLRTRLPRYWASISAVLFWIGSRAQSLGKDMRGLAEVVDGETVAFLVKCQQD
jgi:hypothetical protein